MTCTNCYQSIQSIPLKEYNQLQDPEDSYKNIDVHDIVHPDSTSCSKRYFEEDIIIQHKYSGFLYLSTTSSFFHKI